MFSKLSWIVPAIRSGIIGPLPLYGMCCICVPVMILKSSPEMCWEVPLPAEPKLKRFGLTLSSSTSSRTELTLRLGCTISMFGSVASIVMGAKSLMGSYGSFG